MIEKNHKIFVTGSSGYVASNLIPKINKQLKVFGVDTSCGPFTDLVCDISSSSLNSSLDQLRKQKFTIVNLAAARFDFGATAEDYYNLNVTCHKKFLKSLSNYRVDRFLHISSVAAFDGRNISYSKDLNCDDAYRVTKYIQEVMIQNWCDEKGVELTILYPSAIFSDDPRSDTNIGKLQSISRFLPFIPTINVTKSLTYLPNLSQFIIDIVAGDIPSGKYLTIERPSLTVSAMIDVIAGRSIPLIRIPFLNIILRIVARSLYILGFFGKIDLKLTPNRVVKLFSDTSYSNINCEVADIETYQAHFDEQLTEILAKFNKK